MKGVFIARKVLIPLFVKKIFDIFVAYGRQAPDQTAHSLKLFLTIDFVYIISNLKEFLSSEVTYSEIWPFNE